MPRMRRAWERLVARLYERAFNAWEREPSAGVLVPMGWLVKVRTRRAEVNPARHEPGLARALHTLGLLYLRLERAEEALPPTQRAVKIRTRLAETDPERHEPGLATSLTNLGETLS